MASPTPNDPYAKVEEEKEDQEQEDYIKVAPNEDSDFMEFPIEEDGSVMFSTIQAQIPNAAGIKYKGPSGAWRAIRAVDNVLAAPKGGWGDRIYFISVIESVKETKETKDVQTKKRKTDVDDDDYQIKKSSLDPLLKDLPVTGLPYKITTEELREYFETNYGELELCEVKTDRQTGNSRGFGFIRFKDIETAREAVNNKHQIGERTVSVRIKEEKPIKLFVGRLPRDTSKEDLDVYFSKHGELSDVYLPKPFRNFAFVTFASTEDARRVLRAKHEMKGMVLNVEERKVNPQNEQKTLNNNRSYGNRQSSSREQSYGGGGYNNYSSMRDNQQGAQLGNVLAPNLNVGADLKTLLFHYLSRN